MPASSKINFWTALKSRSVSFSSSMADIEVLGSFREHVCEMGNEWVELVLSLR